MAQTLKRKAHMISLVKSFVNKCREHSGYALRVPDEILDWLEDDEVEPFKAMLRSKHLRQREDGRWESMR